MVVAWRLHTRRNSAGRSSAIVDFVGIAAVAVGEAIVAFGRVGRRRLLVVAGRLACYAAVAIGLRRPLGVAAGAGRTAVIAGESVAVVAVGAFAAAAAVEGGLRCHSCAQLSHFATVAEAVRAVVGAWLLKEAAGLV